MILKYSPIVILNIINPFHDLNLPPAEEPQIMVPKHPCFAAKKSVIIDQDSLDVRRIH